MRKSTTSLKLLASAGLMLAFGTPAYALPPENASPTCSDTLDIAVHGEHIVGDYVTGIGRGELDWPPSDQNIGQIVSDNGGAAVPGGPGPGFHFPNGVAPGASFCNDSQSPGAHL